MRTDHCMASRCAAGPCAACRSGWAWRCSCFQRASSRSRSRANPAGRPNNTKSVACRLGACNMGSMAPSDAEGLTATTLVPFVGVVETETFVQALANKIELGAVQVGQAFGVDQHLHALVLEHHVFGGDLVGVLELVGQARTTSGFHTQAHAHPLAPAGQVFGDVAGCRCGNGD